MKAIKVLLLMLLLDSCVPDFEPEIVTKKMISTDNAEIKWCWIQGIMDQNFGDFVIIEKGWKTDTICKAHNIATISEENGTIIVGFYGDPVSYGSPITLPESLMGFRIKSDTSYKKTSK